MYTKSLVCPDIGNDFHRSLRLACLYSKSVEVFTPIRKEWGPFLTGLSQAQSISLTHLSTDLPEDIADVAAGMAAEIAPEMAAATFLRFHEEYHSDLEMLVNENILLSLSDSFLDEIKTNSTKNFDHLLSFVKDLPEPETGKSGSVLGFTKTLEGLGISYNDFPPNVFELLLDLVFTITSLPSLFPGIDETKLNLNDFARRLDDAIGDDEEHILGGAYLVFMAATQHFRGAIPVTTNEKLIRSFQLFSGYFRNVESTISVGKSFVEYTLPSAENLPLHEIVKMRDDFKSEFEMFWAAIEKFQYEIDATTSHEEQQKQVDEIFIKDVKPAVAVLSNLIQNRKTSLKDVVASSVLPSFLQGSIVFTYMQSNEINFDTSAGLSAIMAFAFPFLEFLKQSSGKDVSKSIEKNHFAILARINQLNS